VLARATAGEANAFITIITPSLGLVRARAQGLRKSGAKLASSLTTFTESSMVLVHGKEGWRVAGAMLQENWFARMKDDNSRIRAARVSGLLLRLVAGEENDSEFFSIISRFFKALTTLPEDEQDAAEVLTVLNILTMLGLDTGKILGGSSEFEKSALAEVMKERANYIARINRGIEASGL